MTTKNWMLLACAGLLFCTFGCTERRSQGERPVIVEEESDSGIKLKAPEVVNDGTKPQQVGEYEHVAQVEEFAGGVVPDERKAKKLVNQLHNYMMAVCSANQACPKTFEDAKKGLNAKFGLFWPKDPWGNFYNYKYIDEQTFEITSFGEDGKPDTEDDIHVAEVNKAK